jgi:putative aldouronate transport system permease protein
MKKIQKDKLIFSAIGYTVVVVTAMLCLIPFIFILSGSFSEEAAIFEYGYRLFPKVFSLDAYKFVFEAPQKIIKAYSVTIFVTAAGTFLGLYLTAMAGYVLNRKELKTRGFFSLYFYFTTLFSGGLVPWYILMTQYFHMENNILSLILPLLFSVFYIIIMRSFMSSIPDSIVESAKIDGAGDFYIFNKIILPLSKPVLATVGLFLALRYWNDWYQAMLFITKEQLYPMQYFLYKILSDMQFMVEAAQIPGVVVVDMPQESFKLAMTVVATGPIIFLYPFLQRFFIKGMTVGAVKG